MSTQGGHGNQFHTFLDCPFGSYEKYPGIVVPQKAYCLPPGQSSSVLLSSIPFTIHGCPGIQLSALLEHRHPIYELDNTIPRTQLAGLPKRPTLRILWPGYEAWTHDNAIDLGDTDSTHRTIAWIAQRAAERIRQFYNDMSTNECGEPDWDLRRIPFESLYLVELRGVSKAGWQPVICRVVS